MTINKSMEHSSFNAINVSLQHLIQMFVVFVAVVVVVFFLLLTLLS